MNKWPAGGLCEASCLGQTTSRGRVRKKAEKDREEREVEEKRTEEVRQLGVTEREEERRYESVREVGVTKRHANLSSPKVNLPTRDQL